MNLRYHLLRLLGYRTFEEMYRDLKKGKRKEISQADLERSAALERALFPRNIRYPREGEEYICLEDAPIQYMTHWMKPYTGGDKAIFPKGETIVIDSIRQHQPTSVFCKAIHANKIEELLIPRTDREQYDYDGYSLMVSTLVLHRSFRLIVKGTE